MRDTAIFKTHQNVVNIIGDSVAYDVNGNEVALNETLIQAELARLQEEYEAKEYQRQRAVSYPSITDQLDTLYHGGYDAWKATITAVKEEFPKP